MEDMEVDFAEGMERVEQVIQSAQKRFANVLTELHAEASGADGVMNLERYVRYLSFQYHLLRGVQRELFRVAAHPDLGVRRGLRDFLVAKASAEEFRFQEAADRVVGQGQGLVAAPLDVLLWHAYFDSRVDARPFLRLGACCLLERIENGAVESFRALFGELPFHAAHSGPGEPQVFRQLASIELEPRHHQDLEEGAIHAATLYLRMLHWALHGISV